MHTLEEHERRGAALTSKITRSNSAPLRQLATSMETPSSKVTMSVVYEQGTRTISVGDARVTVLAGGRRVYEVAPILTVSHRVHHVKFNLAPVKTTT